uniref:YbaK/aminoacyl-tRNA synthetase-associated domain-containing protein n=1 Tax=Desulfovibrio sp. U5L TaxID=596152 RepID=I2Q5G6_9BACT
MTMPPPPLAEAAGETVFDRLLAVVGQSGLPHVIHAHAPTRTMDEAAKNLTFDLARIVKTVAFASRDGGLVLAALPGLRRVAYPQLAALLGCSRRDLSPLSPDEVVSRLGVAPGSVSPLALGGDAAIYVDAGVLAIAPTLYCGFGRPDRTLEIAPADLVVLAGGRTGAFSK